MNAVIRINMLFDIEYLYLMNTQIFWTIMILS